MGFTDKARNKVDEMTGVAKERIGDATHNERMRSEGATQQDAARARQTGEQARPAGRDIKE
ncbi:CsbD family protein [Micromonospora sp. WMMD558]|uniref:CsbD family protein n=1 Tax=unclassified Micromonospora TaxID=2617518 RepID=UPI0012B485C8|nr:CsbD family protein [Micromonospora sp. WMMC415]QGN48854.1 CsbD family protein [Micromonospora sp. WMMC415]